MIPTLQGHGCGMPLEDKIALLEAHAAKGMGGTDHAALQIAVGHSRAGDGVHESRLLAQLAPV